MKHDLSCLISWRFFFFCCDFPWWNFPQMCFLCDSCPVALDSKIITTITNFSTNMFFAEGFVSSLVTIWPIVIYCIVAILFRRSWRLNSECVIRVNHYTFSVCFCGFCGPWWIYLYNQVEKKICYSFQVIWTLLEILINNVLNQAKHVNSHKTIAAFINNISW